MTDETPSSKTSTEIKNGEAPLPSVSSEAAAVSENEVSNISPRIQREYLYALAGRNNGERFTKTTTFRLVLVGILILLLLIPLAMVRSIVEERSASYNTVLSDISAHWGGEQVLTGPILVLPCTESTVVLEQTMDEKGHVTSVQREISDDFRAVLLPKSIRLDGTMRPEYRFRGIYQSLVYSENLVLSGRFEDMQKTVKSLAKEGYEVRFHWDKAFIAVGLSDTKGITRIEPFRFGKQTVRFAPGTRMPHLAASGFHALLSGDVPGENADFSLEIDIKGSNGFKLSPLGELTDMHLASSWAHPSFYGDILPSKRNITEKGFDATWSVPHLVRDYPQFWQDTEEMRPNLSAFSVGVRLFEPVTIYTEATRAAKYGVLFVVLTFLTLVLLEIITQSRPSMVQYVLIGVAVTLFYVLLIALSEHIGFNKAYLIAAAVVVTLNTVYCLFVLSRKLLALVVTTVLSALYSVLFMTLRAEDYALLTGSVLLVMAVAVTMFFTRNLHRQI